ncbi:ABC transporter substrate-binding protein [Aminobacter sp. NyZ550]|jgi:dipeptide transport system substrate-binding protein|uniref:Dipeptide transport system substrate-binding protein n=2 Tax=Aminobacter TaxID=31988 RepID=A0AAC9ASU8_AMIAI|nr:MULTISPECIES: ABC transporter substrate-binding protein [Aminobacter]AMS44266.1 peptide ABC transporter substrate-binding protein [Aminobacter aminovorans]MBA8909293.1 dipeptide transport system substrate-binding protein [Aminobacter ciceronei]MBA9023063.1 dipeptide transport system substrate-binding protein [Aminobacter ciceronei]MBB3709528.1 dipeptide transport system substrate-binding protein [Aminobacter aminovorans]WAX95162.1 ABC transporter substrate-binding protein [Aminobacter sp. N
MLKKTTFAAALLAATVLSGAASAKTFVYCSEGSPEGFDPGLYTAGTTFDAAAHTVYNRLLEFKKGTTETEPGLAESYTVSDDGLEYTFKLRPGVKYQTTEFFTPTRDFNADDVVFSFDRQLKADNPWNKYVTGASWEYAAGMGFPEVIKSVEKVDDLTVKITLTRKEAPFLANVAMPFASIVSKEYADKLQADGKMNQMNQMPLGTGPFAFVAYQQDAIIRYKANPDYWGGKQKIDDLVFAITPDASVRYQKLKAGECHLMPFPNAADVAAMKADTNLKVVEQEGLNVAYLAYNTTQAPFDKPEVRKALNQAINKQAIVDAVFQGAATPATNPIPPTMWSYNKAVEDDKYDPEASKKGLEAAGVKDLKMKVWAMPVSRPYMLNARRAAELIQSDFAKVGVTVEIVSYEWAEYLDKSKAKDRDGAVMLGWTGDNGDPDNFLDTLLGCDAVGGNNRAQWCNKEFDDLVTKAKETSDIAERTKLYEQAQVVFKKDAPWATIDHSLSIVPMRKGVEGFVQSPLGDFAFDGVDITE